jgi:hypothetical protein
MAGLVPAIHVSGVDAAKTWMPARSASEATPFFERLCAGMTTQQNGGIGFDWPGSIPPRCFLISPYCGSSGA